VGEAVVDHLLFLIPGVSIHSGDIRDQSLKLSEIAPNFGRFVLPHFRGEAPKVAPIFSCLPRSTSRGIVCEITTPSPKVLGAHALKFGPIFELLLSTNDGGLPAAVDVG